MSKCTCPNGDYRGVGCETMVNHCGDPKKCENGGICVNLAPGFRCDCPTGYAGANCSINVNDCSNNCPSTSTCIDMVNAHYCRCPLGKTGESCVKDLDTNYDLYFYLTSQDGYTALPYPIYLSGSSFSLSVWVRFYQSSLTGTFLTIFIAKSANSLAGVTKFLSLDHEGLVVYDKNGQNPQRAAYQQQTVTDGQWNYVVVSWNKDSGFDLVVNSLRQSQIPTTPYTSMMAENVWVTLGADFDSTILPKANNGFRGHISQLNIYNRVLSFDDEMPQLIPDPQKIFNGSILRWNEFVYYRGVQPVYPSSVQKPCTGANCLAYNKTFPTFKKSCPYNVYMVLADRLTTVTWTEPIPQDGTVQQSTYKSGDKFSWGKYTNMYAIRDAANSSTFCSFNIYVMPEQCVYPDPPHLGTRTYEMGYYPYFGCTIGCTDANRRIDRDTPKVYTCGPSGAWSPYNRNIPLRFPSCGLVQSHARRRLMMEIAYPNISTTFCDTLPLKLREAFTSVNTRWSNQICSQPNCSDMTVVVNCLTTPTSVKMIIPTSKATLTRSSPAETLSVEEILIRSVLESRLLDISTEIPNGSPDLNLFNIDSTESCPTRQSVVDGSCVKCGPGNFFNSSSLVCEDCPVGTYQDQDDQTSCTPCPLGSTTQTVASPSSSDCKPICSPGHYQTGSRCDPCGVGFYQSQYGMFYCDPCPVNSTTRGDSSTSASLCDVSSSVTNEQSDRRKNETITVYYIIGFSCTGIIVILLVTVVCILVRRHLKLVKEMHSSHYVKTIDSSTLQQIDANYDTQYQELEESHYHYLTPCDANSQL